MEYKHQIILKFIVVIVFTAILFTSLKIIIEAEEPKISTTQSVSPWEGVNTHEVSGKPVDSCLCTQIKGQLYKVNVRERQIITYTPLKNEK